SAQGRAARGRPHPRLPRTPGRPHTAPESQGNASRLAPLPQVGSDQVRALLALDVAEEALLAGDLAVGEDVLAVLVRILALLEHEPHRCPHQLEALAEEILQVAPIAFRERLQAV